MSLPENGCRGSAVFWCFESWACDTAEIKQMNLCIHNRCMKPKIPICLLLCDKEDHGDIRVLSEDIRGRQLRGVTHMSGNE